MQRHLPRRRGAVREKDIVGHPLEKVAPSRLAGLENGARDGTRGITAGGSRPGRGQLGCEGRGRGRQLRRSRHPVPRNRRNTSVPRNGNHRSDDAVGHRDAVPRTIHRRVRHRGIGRRGAMVSVVVRRCRGCRSPVDPCTRPRDLRHRQVGEAQEGQDSEDAADHDGQSTRTRRARPTPVGRGHPPPDANRSALPASSAASDWRPVRRISSA
jgi:hypothetical protein